MTSDRRSSRPARKRRNRRTAPTSGALRPARLADLAHDAIILRDLDGKILFWNKGAVKEYVWSKKEAVGRNMRELLRTRFPSSREEMQRQLLERGYWEGEMMHTRRDGQRITVASRKVMEQGKSGKPPVVLVINRNVTERVEMERKLRESEESLRRFTGYLLQSQDEERRRISRELQDHISPLLTGVLSRLYRINKNVSGLDISVQNALEECLRFAESEDAFVRNFSSTLHPPILDEGGLAAALRWFADSMAIQGEMRIDLETSREACPLPKNVERSLYRMVQEVIACVRLRHKDSPIKIALGSTAGEFVLEIHVLTGEVAPGSGDTAESAGLSETSRETLRSCIAKAGERVQRLGGKIAVSQRSPEVLLRAVLPLAQVPAA